MTISFAATIGHAPGWVAWPDRATEIQRQALGSGATQLRAGVTQAELDVLVMLTSEHWTNFFLDHVSPFCLGRGESFQGPVEPWMKIDRLNIPGDPELATQILEAAYGADIEVAFGYDFKLDHGTMVPLSFLTPGFDLPIVPIFFNTLAPPQPSPRRCFRLGEVIGDVARKSPKRIGIVATGGMSHDPGEIRHGFIDSDFDLRFLEQMATGDIQALSAYTIEDLAASGAGTIELIAWIALAGALGRFAGNTITYQAVTGWATGMGIMQLEPVMGAR